MSTTTTTTTAGSTSTTIAAAPTISDADKKAIQDAFGAASASDLTFTSTDKDTAKKITTFKLKSAAYYNLQNYIFSAMKLDNSIDAFKAHWPVDNLKALTDLEPNIYWKMQTTIVDIFSHCRDFDAATMPVFMTLTASIMAYCDDFARYVGGHKLLLECIATLSDPTADATTVLTAQHRADFICDLLDKRAVAKAAECDALHSQISAFKDVTAGDKVRVDYLVNQFIRNGPFEPATQDSFDYQKNGDGSNKRRQKDGKDMVPYGQTLQGALTALLSDATAQADAARRDYDEWKEDTIVAATAVTYMWLFPAGTIAGAVTMGIYTDRAIKAKERYATESAKADLDNQEASTLKGCIELVNHLSTHFDDLESRITLALEALQAMQNQFLGQSAGFKAIKNAVSATDNWLQADSTDIRSMASDEITPALEAWVEIKTLAQDFINSANVNYTVV